jgi:steroid delta-isomerase-like uncharacterized protein
MTDHKARTRQMYSSMKPGQDVDAMIDEFLAEDFVEHEEIPGMDSTRETPRQFFSMLFGAMPDFHADVQDVLQDGDKVAVRATFAGTHQGEFMNIPPKGNHVEFEVFDVLQFRDDKVVAHWGVMDMAAVMEQMGAPTR